MLRDPEIALKARPQRTRSVMDRIETGGPAAANDEIAVRRLLEGEMAIGVSNQAGDGRLGGFRDDHLERRARYGNGDAQHGADLRCEGAGGIHHLPRLHRPTGGFDCEAWRGNLDAGDGCFRVDSRAGRDRRVEEPLRGDQRVDLAFLRTIGRAKENLVQSRLQPAQVRRADDLTFDALRALDSRLLLEKGKVAFRLGEHQSAGDLDLNVRDDFIRELPPMTYRLSLKRQRFRGEVDISPCFGSIVER